MIDTASLTELLIATLDDNKGSAIVEVNTTIHNTLCERMLVCTATSNRHAKTLASKAWVAAKQAGVAPLGQEGDDDSGWSLLDLDTVIVHVMTAEVREYYQLEELWCKTPDQHIDAD